MSLPRGPWVGRPMPNRADLRSDDLLNWLRQNVASSRKVLYLQALAFVPSATAGTLVSGSYVLPAGIIAQVEEGFEVYAYGVTAATANSKTALLFVGGTLGTASSGTQVFTTGSAAANNQPWVIAGTFVRNANASFLAYVEGRHNNALVSTIRTSVAINLGTTDLPIQVNLTAATANSDIVQEFLQVERMEAWNYSLGQ